MQPSSVCDEEKYIMTIHRVIVILLMYVYWQHLCSTLRCRASPSHSFHLCSWWSWFSQFVLSFCTQLDPEKNLCTRSSSGFYRHDGLPVNQNNAEH